MPGADDIAEAELGSLRARGLLRSLEPLRTPQGVEVELRPGERLINFSSNDYLGLAGDPRLPPGPGDRGGGGGEPPRLRRLPPRAPAGAGAGALRRKRGGGAVRQRVRGELRDPARVCWTRGSDRLRRIEPRLDRRRMPPVPRADRGVPARGR